MATSTPDYRNATELIKDHFPREASKFKGTLEDFMVEVGEWVYAAYEKGVEEGFEDGEHCGYEEGREEGRTDGYDEGYDDARAEFDNDW